MDLIVQKLDTKPQKPKLNIRALRNRDSMDLFAESFNECMHAKDGRGQSINRYCCNMNSASNDAATRVLPAVPSMPKRPWISKETLDLIDQRAQARIEGRWNQEKRLHQSVKDSVKKDRARWLDALLASGEWDHMRSLCKGFCPK